MVNNLEELTRSASDAAADINRLQNEVCIYENITRKHTICIWKVCQEKVMKELSALSIWWRSFVAVYMHSGVTLVESVLRLPSFRNGLPRIAVLSCRY